MGLLMLAVKISEQNLHWYRLTDSVPVPGHSPQGKVNHTSDSLSYCKPESIVNLKV